MGIDERIAKVAARQLGLITRGQAELTGATRSMIQHRIKRRRWEPVHRGVFRVNGSPRSFDQKVLAACLAGGDEAVASHWTASSIWGLVETSRPDIEISIPPSRHCRGNGFIVHHVRLSERDMTRRGVIPITTPFRTLVDLAGVVETPTQLECAFDSALRQRLITLPKLTLQVAALEGSTLPGLGSVRRIVESRLALGVPQSLLETHFAALMREQGLPEPVRQYTVKEKRKVIAILDFAFPDLMMAIECDGSGFHSMPADLDRDVQRGNQLALAGWLVLRFSWRDVLWRGRSVCKTIASALEMRR